MGDNRSRLDPTQITQREHDEAAKAKRVKITDTEINMELNHADGDSVTSHPAKLSVSVEGVTAQDDGTVIIPAMDCSSLRHICGNVEGSGTIDVEVSHSDTHDSWVTIATNVNEVDVPVCARRVRVRSNNVLGDVHIAGRS